MTEMMDNYHKNNHNEMSTFWRGTHSTTNQMQCSLSIYYVSFPSTEDVKTQDKWNEKMKTIGIQWTGIGNEEDEPFKLKWENYPF